MPIDYDMTKALKYVKKLNDEQSEHKITVTHLTTKAVAVAISKMRRDIGRIKWGYVIESDLISLQFQKADKLGITILVDVDGGKDLVPVTIWEAQDHSVLQIAKDCNEIVMKTKNKNNIEHNDVTKIFMQLPNFILGFLVTTCTYLA